MEPTGQFKLPMFEQMSPSGLHIRWYPNEDRFTITGGLAVTFRVTDLPWLLKALQALADQEVTVAVSGYGGGGRGKREARPANSGGETVMTTTTLGELAQGIPVTIGK